MELAGSFTDFPGSFLRFGEFAEKHQLVVVVEFIPIRIVEHLIRQRGLNNSVLKIRHAIKTDHVFENIVSGIPERMIFSEDTTHYIQGNRFKEKRDMLEIRTRIFVDLHVLKRIG